MLLTLKPSPQNGIKGPHEYAIIRQSVPTQRSSPSPVPDSAATAPRSMDSSHRGLPPPLSMTLPPPDVGLSAMAPMNQLPPPPPQWQSSEDSMRHWLQAKAEEDRKKQEEERTRQETLRLEQRKIEQNMLRDSLQAGVPPHMVPLIFAGISGGNLPQSVLELAQQYMPQVVGARGSAPPPPQQQQSSGLDLPPPPPHPQRRPPLGLPADVRRDSRTLPPNPYAAPAQHAAPGPVPSQPVNPSGHSPTKQTLGCSPLSTGPADPGPPTLSQINTVEAQSQHPHINLSNTRYAPGSSFPSSQSASAKQEFPQRQSPPSLYFHHWVPPGQPQQNTPSGKVRQESPLATSQSSPGRKRKSQGPHPPPPLPSYRRSDAPTSASQVSQPSSPVAGSRRAWHFRQRSDASSSYDSRDLDLDQDNSGPIHIQAAPRSMPPPGDLGPERDQSRTDDPTRSAGPSTYPRYYESDSSTRQNLASVTVSESVQPRNDDEHRSPRGR